ncbi:hypothetical protein ACVWY3_003271 [Bradyrhizobium sp. USDA 4486]
MGEPDHVAAGTAVLAQLLRELAFAPAIEA